MKVNGILNIYFCFLGGFDKAGLKSGKGTMVYGNGDWYEGEWFNNAR